MNDKELLELAAKAAGMDGLGLFWDDRLKCLWDAEGLTFDPLTDDGDALRLAVKLDTNIEVWNPFKEVWVVAEGYDVIEEPWDEDKLAATRRAIVRAAAEIGRGME